jgi:APA family basic amino acid/polyamine antiporter
LVKLAALFGLIIFGFMGINKTTWNDNWATGFSFGKMDGNALIPYVGFAAIGAISGAMVGSLFSSDSWNNVTFIANEIKNPKTQYWSITFFWVRSSLHLFIRRPILCTWQ